MSFNDSDEEWPCNNSIACASSILFETPILAIPTVLTVPDLLDVLIATPDLVEPDLMIESPDGTLSRSDQDDAAVSDASINLELSQDSETDDERPDQVEVRAEPRHEGYFDQQQLEYDSQDEEKMTHSCRLCRRVFKNMQGLSIHNGKKQKHA